MIPFVAFNPPPPAIVPQEIQHIEALRPLRWKHRVLLLVGPENSPESQRQLAALKEVQAGLKERDILILRTRSPALQAALQSKAFEVLLIGKDGGIKWRQQSPLSSQQLFAIIDAMPMRRQEMGKHRL